MSVKTVPGALDILNQKLGGNAGDIPASSTKEYALEKIYRTLGGEEALEGVNTTSEIIEKIADVAEGGGGGSSDLKTAKINVIATNNGALQYRTIINGVLNTATLNGSGEVNALVSSDGEVYIVEISGAQERTFDSVTFTDAVNCEGGFSKPDDPHTFGVIITDINVEASITAEVTYLAEG